MDGKKERRRRIDFIKCDDKGDTTFLKVQMFSNVCFSTCPVTAAQEMSKSLRKLEKGSGIAWTGSCVSFKMDDGWGKPRISEQCQLQQASSSLLLHLFQ